MTALLLLSAAAAGDDLSPQYQWLQLALRDHQQIAATGGWPSVPDGPTLRPGSDDPRIPALALRLAATGDLQVGGTFTAYDEALQAAVVRFQARHGLEQDALVGKSTLRELNVPVAQRINQIRLSLDRTRQVFQPDREDMLLINVPAFRADLFRNGAKVWSTRVIVGETKTETPLFESMLKTVVLNPTWSVPHKIASEELLPKIRRDSDFLTRGGYDVIDSTGARVDPDTVDWSSLHRKNFPFTLVQRPGPANELGSVKFLFPNPYSVFMHDTPAKYLFERDARAFSHGCIRTQNPLDLAVQVLAAEGWTRERIDEQLATAETHNVVLSVPLPVVVAYLTAEADERGTVYFYRDIYENDLAVASQQPDFCSHQNAL